MIRILPRELGVVIECNRCGEKVQTAMCGRARNRAWWKKHGWGRGLDRGTTGTWKDGFCVKPGRPRTTAHDFCPKCMKLELAAAKEREAKRAEQIKQRDQNRKQCAVAPAGAP